MVESDAQKSTFLNLGPKLYACILPKSRSSGSLACNHTITCSNKLKLSFTWVHYVFDPVLAGIFVGVVGLRFLLLASLTIFLSRIHQSSKAFVNSCAILIHYCYNLKRQILNFKILI